MILSTALRRHTQAATAVLFHALDLRTLADNLSA